MDQWIKIRQRVHKEGVSKRQIMRETGMHWETLKKILEHSIPPGYERSKPPRKPKIGPYLDRIRQILEQDKLIHKKQRHTAKRIWEVLRLLERYSVKEVTSAVQEALRRRIHTKDGVAQFLTGCQASA